MKHIDATEIRRNFVDVVDRVRMNGERLIVDRNGRPLVAIVSVEDAKRLEATSGFEPGRPVMNRPAIDALIGRFVVLPVLDDRTAEQILGYGEDGLSH